MKYTLTPTPNGKRATISAPGPTIFSIRWNPGRLGQLASLVARWRVEDEAFLPSGQAGHPTAKHQG